MRKYYTRACNFYHGRVAKNLIKSKKALPLNGNKYLAFDNLEIFERTKKKIKIYQINLKDINKLKRETKKIVKKDLTKRINHFHK